MSARVNGQQGENAVEALLTYAGCRILGRQVLAGDHVLDFLVEHPELGETLIEVKVWAAGGGKDIVKKAIADAYDLRSLGERRPYVLVLSHQLGGLYGAMLRRAVDAGAISRVLILTLVESS